MEFLVLRFLTIAIVGVLIALMLYAGEPAELWWWLLALPFGVWIVGPAVIPYFFARQCRTRRWFVHVMLALLTVSNAWSASIYYHAFFVSTSSTAALVMIFVPLYQWTSIVCLGVLGGVAIIWSNRRKSPA
ncbi:hypothetical protein [Sphingomonas endolithica]|uniref:hypothetical protein n=1 Tax=Sphingomonas endolithica TaxID=2972485 RepID=UPI0021AEA174|nr:hypothetical protein [Sphingomonas sp. ZFBP2030]